MKQIAIYRCLMSRSFYIYKGSNNMADNSSKDILFRKFQFGVTDLRNRIAMAPMTRSKSPGGVPNDDVVAYYRKRAEASAG